MKEYSTVLLTHNTLMDNNLGFAKWDLNTNGNDLWMSDL